MIEFYFTSKNECKQCICLRVSNYRKNNIEVVRQKDREDYYEKAKNIPNKKNTFFKDNKNI